MTLTICNFSGSPENVANPEIGWKIAIGRCPNCLERDTLFRWPLGAIYGNDMHDLCTHYHCKSCDADYCWPPAWSLNKEPLWVPSRMDGLTVHRMIKAPDTPSIEKLLKWNRAWWKWYHDGRDEIGRFVKRPRRPRVKYVVNEEVHAQ